MGAVCRCSCGCCPSSDTLATISQRPVRSGTVPSTVVVSRGAEGAGSPCGRAGRGQSAMATRKGAQTGRIAGLVSERRAKTSRRSQAVAPVPKCTNPLDKEENSAGQRRRSASRRHAEPRKCFALCPTRPRCDGWSATPDHPCLTRSQLAALGYTVTVAKHAACAIFRASAKKVLDAIALVGLDPIRILVDAVSNEGVKQDGSAAGK